MDFDSLPRRDLQFFCKRNKIPANMTNIAMADALKALEIVEGIEEFANRSPTSVALPSGARTAARKKSTKDETQSSELVTRSCLVTSKSLAGEMDQENTNANVLQNPSLLPLSRRGAAATSVAINLEAAATATPVARSTRKAQVAASSKKEESVQRVYSTRRSVRLLEESMADLSLKSTIAPKNKDAEKEVSSQGSKLQGKSEDNNCENTEEAEVISVRDLNDSLDKEWDGSMNDPDLDVLYGDLGDITFSDANTTTEQMSGIESNTVSASDNFVLVEEQESQEEDFVVVDHAAASTTTTNIVACNKLSEETDPCEDDDDSGVVVDTNQEAIGSKVAASDKVDCVPTVLVADDASEESELEVEEMDEMADESKELESEESESEEEEMCESDEVAPMSDKKKTQDFSSSSEKEGEPASDDEWSDYDPRDIDVKLDLVALADINNKNKESVEEIVVNNNGEIKAEAEPKKMKKKKTVDEESLKETSMRQLTKMLKEQLAIKSKQQQDKCAE